MLRFARNDRKLILTQAKQKVGFTITFILMLAFSISGCSALAEFIPLLASPTITPTPGPTITVTPTKTMVTFNRWTSTPIGEAQAVGIKPTWTLYPTQTLRPSWTPWPESTLRPTWTPSLTFTPSATLSPTATPEIFRFLYEMFESDADAWLQSSGENWSTAIRNGIYEMRVTMPNVEITSSRTWLKQAEVRLDAEIGFIAGDGYAGFNCREGAGSSSYYTLFITSDGQYGLGHTLNLKQNFLILAPHPAIRIGQDNQVRAECRGNTITLWVNGTQVAREEVEALGPGFAGMMVGTRYGDEQVMVHFDNFQVWGPADYAIETATPEGMETAAP